MLDFGFYPMYICAMKELNLIEIETYYRIEDGRIWSNRLERYLKPSLVNGYAIVSLPDVGLRYIGIHRLVALKYFGRRPSGAVVWHKDDNCLNNSRDNLGYISLSNAIHKGRTRGKLRLGVLPEVMPNPRLKPVICSDGREWGSVGECAAALGITRVGVYKAIKRGGMRGGLVLSHR